MSKALRNDGRMAKPMLQPQVPSSGLLALVCGQSAESDGHEAGTVGEFDRAAVALCRRLWPTKTAAWLAIAGEVTVDHAARLLSGRRGFSLPTFRRLLCSKSNWTPTR